MSASIALRIQPMRCSGRNLAQPLQLERVIVPECSCFVRLIVICLL